MKGGTINEGAGGSSSTLVKSASNFSPKDKGKTIEVVQYDEENKKIQAIKLEKQRKISSVLRQQANDPPGLNKVDPNNKWCYETIEIVVIGKNEEFRKMPKMSFAMENSDFNQLDFPIN